MNWWEEDEFNRSMEPPATKANRPSDRDESWRDGPPSGVGTGAGTGNDGPSTDDSAWGKLFGNIWESFNKKGEERSGLENMLWTAGTAIGGSVIDKFHPSQAKRMADESLARMEQNTLELERQKRGMFTPEERRDIEDASEPMVNRVAQGVGARGLASSGAGAQIVAEAQQKPFFDAMGNARRQFSQENVRLWEASTQMAAMDPSFGSILGDWAAEYFYLRDNGINDQTMQMLAEWMKEANEMYTEISELMKKGVGMAEERSANRKGTQEGGAPVYSDRDTYTIDGPSEAEKVVKSSIESANTVAKPIPSSPDLSVSAAPGVQRNPGETNRQPGVNNVEVNPSQAEQPKRGIPVPGEYTEEEMLDVVKGLNKRMQEIISSIDESPDLGNTDLEADPITGAMRKPVAGDREANIVSPDEQLQNKAQPDRAKIDAADQIVEISRAVKIANRELKRSQLESGELVRAPIYEKGEDGVVRPKMDDQGKPVHVIRPKAKPKSGAQARRVRPSLNQNITRNSPSIGAVTPPEKPPVIDTPVSKVPVSKPENEQITFANGFVGLSEKKDKAKLMGLFDKHNVKYLGESVDPEKTPWCAAFVWAILAEKGYDYLPTLTAREYSAYGEAGTGKDGDLAVWYNPETRSGHVGFVVKTEDGIKILGGNQKNHVSLADRGQFDRRMTFLGYRTPVRSVA